MTVIALPAGLRIGGFTIGQARYDLAEMSDATGSMSARLFGPPRWKLGLASTDGLTMEQAATWEALVLQLRGGVNHLTVHDVVRPQPIGTMRGTMTLNGSHSAGAVALSVTAGAGQAAKTLLAGDWLQLASGLGTSQLVKVMAAATSNGSGVIALTVEPPLRIAFSGGAAVTWDRPVAYYKQLSTPQWAYQPGRTMGGFAVDLLESWS
jgi:hypothetical protein